VTVQVKLARHLRDLARGERGRPAQHLLGWAHLIQTLPDEDPHIQAIARAQAEAGSPERFVPRCDDGLHLRLLAEHEPSELLLEHIASLEGAPEPWRHGDWATEGPAPERDGRPQWTVEAELLTHGHPLSGRWPPKLAHEQLEPIQGFGIGEWDGGAHLRATLAIWAAGADEAEGLARSLLAAYFADAAVHAHRLTVARTPGPIEARPRGPADLEETVEPVRWQRAVVDGQDARILWYEHGYRLERVDIAETPDTVTITILERRDARYGPDGVPIARVLPSPRPHAVRVRLAAPIGQRTLLDGATGRAPDDLGVWEIQSKRLLDDMLALDPGSVPCRVWPKPAALPAPRRA
jgi:hypothetical protein